MNVGIQLPSKKNVAVVFITKIENYDEPTIVIFFGDHLINLQSNVHEEHGYIEQDTDANRTKMFFETPLLIMSNMVIALIKNLIPDKVRIPAFIVVIASFVTIIEMLMQAYIPSLYAALGVFIPLIVVNCIILGRAEAFASKNGVLDSALDGIGIGLGFTLSLTTIGAVREVLGAGSIFGYSFADGVMPLLFILAPGGFLVLGYLMVLFNKVAKR